ncbi:MAG: AAA family ATPase, partial [Myxococcales bacterium]|nr:AAA family ATPase [Myxococcales bacterium]
GAPALAKILPQEVVYQAAEWLGIEWASSSDQPSHNVTRLPLSHIRPEPACIDQVGNSHATVEGDGEIAVVSGSNWLDDGSIDSWFDGVDIIRPPARNWIFHEVLPAKIVAMVAGAGGVGKGRLCLAMAVSGATGTEFGPFKPIGPGTWIIIGKEDDREELQRRLDETVRNWPGEKFNDEQIRLLKQNLIIPEIRPGLKFGTELVEELEEFCDRRDTKTDGIIFDPYSRFCDTASGFSMNSQEGAAESHNWLGQIQQATNSTVVAVHHLNQSGHQDLQIGRQMNPTQITGNMQITDFSRLVIQLGIDSKSNASNARGGRIINVQVTKSNYTMLPDEPWKFEILEGGAIVPATLDRESGAVRAVVEIIAASEGKGITRGDLIDAAKSQLGLSRQFTQRAITAAQADGSIEYRGNRKTKGDFRLFLAESGPKSAVGSEKDSGPGGINHVE